MAAEGLQTAGLVGAFADPAGRAQAAAALARHLGAEDLLIFAPDPELGVYLPAPGLRQTLGGAAAWRAFVGRCASEGGCTDALPGMDGRPVPARGCAADGVVLVVTGEGAAAVELDALRPVLPVLGALFRAERRVDTVEVRARSADEAAERARVLNRTLQQVRGRLEEALHDAEEARAEARARAEYAEQLAEELQAQASEMEEQAAEMEMLNEALEARTAEAELARAAADTANRAKSDFLATMSHELRTPINAVLGYNELLDLEIAGPVTAGQRQHIQRIRSSTRHLLTLINDILDLAKVEAGQLTVEHEADTVGVVIREAVALVGAQYAEREVTLRNECAEPDTPYVGDRDRVRQILLNLLSNAVKFTECGGSVAVRCSTTTEPPAGASLAGPGPWTCLQVEDSGIGIGPDEVGSVFEPFVQVEGGRTRTRGGTGLGLTISRQLSRLMGGDLTLRSEKGRGSCFSLWLPSHTAAQGSIDESILIRIV
ncbi:MAG TPA: ATP-binding protein [Longimicrobium sp.]|nr:ATP-binding protein [Longimicrobium sp.]